MKFKNQKKILVGSHLKLIEHHHAYTVSKFQSFITILDYF